jgi:phage head maturation protease
MNLDVGLQVDLEEKAVQEADDCFRVSGYAAVFGNRDLGDDIIQAGAFADSLMACPSCSGTTACRIRPSERS